MKENCWEFKKCGREPNGNKVAEYGVCPASTEERLDGKNSGKNSGRACWVVTGTFCEGEIQGSHSDKETNCLECDFFWKVRDEEGDSYSSPMELIDLIL